MTTANEGNSFELIATVGRYIQRTWAGQDMMEKAEADLAALDAVIADAGHDSATLTRLAYEWARQTYQGHAAYQPTPG